MTIVGSATSAGTRRFSARSVCPAGHFRRVGDQFWSSVGIGTYLGAVNEITDRLVEFAVIDAVAGGINVIDTAANYRREQAEKSIGRSLEKLISRGQVNRDELIICSKGGYLPFGAEGFRQDVSGKVGNVTEDDMVGGSHCMHPDYLEWQLNRSLENLGIDTLDVYYVHNPEAQAGKITPDLFERRLEQAFRMLEGAVLDGKIRAYGIATWNAFRLPVGQTAYMSLQNAKSIALCAADGDRDNFRFIQMPIHLAALEGLQLANQTVGADQFPAVRAALNLGIRTIASSAIGQAKLTELPEHLGKVLGDDLSDVQRALQFTRSAPGIATALVGMKQPDHVLHNLELCQIPPLPAARVRTLYA